MVHWNKLFKRTDSHLPITTLLSEDINVAYRETALVLPCKIKEREEGLDCLILHVAWLYLTVSKRPPLSLKYPFCCLCSWKVLMRPPCFASTCFDHRWQSCTRCSWILLDHVYTVVNSWVLWIEDAGLSGPGPIKWQIHGEELKLSIIKEHCVYTMSIYVNRLI